MMSDPENKEAIDIVRNYKIQIIKKITSIIKNPRKMFL